MATLTEDSIVSRDGARSRKPSPLRAVMPLQAMHRTSPLRLRNRASPEPQAHFGMGAFHACNAGGTQITSCHNRQRGNQMRRTSSLDAIYQKGQWPRDSLPHFTHLLLNKATQTPQEWAELCDPEVTVGCSELLRSDSPNYNSSSTSSNGSRRASGSVPTSPWPQSPVPQAVVTGENMDKFIRQRLQRTNKDVGSGPGLRCSPVPADHSIIVPTPILPKPYACVQANSRSASIPHLSKGYTPRFRSSIEELNQEIELLVLKPFDLSPESCYDDCSYQQDGRKAPFPDYFRGTRSVNTQTPLKGASATSSTCSSPSPPASPSLDVITPPGSPGIIAIASPHINKFLAREPPDGCEKVALKPSEDKSCPGSWPPVRPTFKLLPSLGSAFSMPDRSGAHSMIPIPCESEISTIIQ